MTDVKLLTAKTYYLHKFELSSDDAKNWADTGPIVQLDAIKDKVRELKQQIKAVTARKGRLELRKDSKLLKIEFLTKRIKMVSNVIGRDLEIEVLMLHKRKEEVELKRLEEDIWMARNVSRKFEETLRQKVEIIDRYEALIQKCGKKTDLPSKKPSSKDATRTKKQHRKCKKGPKCKECELLALYELNRKLDKLFSEDRLDILGIGMGLF